MIGYSILFYSSPILPGLGPNRQNTPALQSPSGGGRGLLWGNLLLRRVVGESDTLLDVALQALDSSIEQSLLLIGDVGKDVDGLLGTIGLAVVS